MIRLEAKGTFLVKEELKELGCSWDGEAWCCPDEVAGRAEVLVARGELERQREREVRCAEWFEEYLNSLAWGRGSLAESTYNAGLRACSLGVPVEDAVNRIFEKRRAGGGRLGIGQTRREVHRAYAFAEVNGGGDSTSNVQGRGSGNAFEPQMAQMCADGGQALGRVATAQKARFAPGVLAKVSGRMARVVCAGWLGDRSAVNPVETSPEAFLGALYFGGEKVLVFDEFKSQGQWVADRNADAPFEPQISQICADDAGVVLRSSRVDHRGLYDRERRPVEVAGTGFTGRGRVGIWYLCAPVSGEWVWMEEAGSAPHWSRRWERCVVAWRYMVFESDEARERDWVGAIVQLPLRIVAIYTSGSRSIHVLVRVDASSKEEWDAWRDAMKAMLVPLGADKMCFSGVRLTRLPGCWRLGTEKKTGGYQAYGRPGLQKLLYLNPAAGMGPICDLPRRGDLVGQYGRLGESLAQTDSAERDVEALGAFSRAVVHFPSEERVQRWKGVVA